MKPFQSWGDALVVILTACLVTAYQRGVPPVWCHLPTPKHPWGGCLSLAARRAYNPLIVLWLHTTSVLCLYKRICILLYFLLCIHCISTPILYIEACTCCTTWAYSVCTAFQFRQLPMPDLCPAQCTCAAAGGRGSDAGHECSW